MEHKDTPLSFKWYKFIIHGYLYIVAILSVVVGVVMIGGQIYADMTEVFYGLFPMLQMVNTFFGVMQLVLAVIALFVRDQLAKWRVNGPLFLLIYQIFSLVYYASYVAGTSLVLNTLALDWLSGGYMLLQIVLIVVNKIYFGKRADTFVY